MNKEDLSGLIDKFVVKKISLQDIKDVSAHVKDDDFDDQYTFTESLKVAIEQNHLNEVRRKLSEIIDEEHKNETKIRFFQLQGKGLQAAAVVFFMLSSSFVYKTTTSYNNPDNFKKIHIDTYVKTK